MSITAELSPERLADDIRLRRNRSSAEVCAYWIQIKGDRDQLARQLREELGGDGAIVAIVREVGFNNPNSVPADLMLLLDRCRDACISALAGRTRDNLRLTVVLLARTRLSVPQSASPAALPNWYPYLGGHTVVTFIEDLTWIVDAPLSCPEANIDGICECLHSLDGVLVRRLRSAHAADHNAGNAFMNLVRTEADSRYEEILARFAESHRGITAPRAFRPSLRAGGSLTARLWRVTQCHTPESVHKPAKALGRALGLPDQLPAPWKESLESVIRRPSNRSGTDAQSFVRSTLLTIGASCQFVTAAAHADAYARYPVPLLVSYSYDLRKTLTEAEQMVLALPEGRALLR